MSPPIDHFGILAPFYERFIRPKVSQTFWRLVDARPGQTLLDAGGGTGRVSQELAGQGLRVVVADESTEMLREVSLKEGLLPLRTLTESLPFADETFERVIMVDALHHVAHQQRSADELFRVLKPGGSCDRVTNVELFAVRAASPWAKTTPHAQPLSQSSPQGASFFMTAKPTTTFAMKTHCLGARGKIR
jgi:ubiquinone/menaquinone biosynthesis C-methylase UbiE